MKIPKSARKLVGAPFSPKPPRSSRHSSCESSSQQVVSLKKLASLEYCSCRPLASMEFRHSWKKTHATEKEGNVRLARGNGKVEGGKVKSDVFPLYVNLKFNFFLSQQYMRGLADANNLICYAWAIRRNLLLICVGQTDENLKLIFFSFLRRYNFCF